MIKDILQNILHMDIQVSEYPKASHFMLYMLNGRKLWQVKIVNIEFLLVEFLTSTKIGIVALKKQLAKYQEQTGKCVAFLFPEISRIERDKFIQHGIPFVVLKGQLYLPFLGLLLQDKFQKKRIISADKMTPAAQLMFLYLLYNNTSNGITKTALANYLNLTKTSITRASNILLHFGLIEESKIGKEVMVKPICVGKEYYEKAKPYLINPVHKEFCINKPVDTDNLIIAGESALSKLSMLNEPQILTMAIDKSLYKDYLYTEVSEHFERPETICKLQLWWYDPTLFSSNGTADIISIVCSMKDVFDERVEKEIELLLERL